MRNTKIVCTIGPASEQPEVMKELILAGMNVARLNFSHGSHEEHAARIETIRACAKELGRNVAILLDTKGPEIRTGVLENGQITLQTGDSFTLTTEDKVGNQEFVHITYDKLPEDVYVGATILMDDGLIELRVEAIAGKDIHCRVINGGVLKNRKGINLPKISVNLPGVTEKDVADILFGIRMNVDFIAASFVRKALDVLEIKEILQEHEAEIAIIAKIENEEGVANAAEILEVADGLMVARGDLGVEIPAEEVPLVQKQLITACNQIGKPVITATQMLDSMQQNPRPTRAEASDVANAIFDGTDAIMLSGETAAGKYPVEAVAMMDKISRKAEASPIYQNELVRISGSELTITDAIAKSAAITAQRLEAKAILIPTESGRTANIISKYRPSCPVIAVTPHEKVRKRLSLVRGVQSILFEIPDSVDEMMDKAIQAAIEAELVQLNDVTVITGGYPVRKAGTTNVLQVRVVGNVRGAAEKAAAEMLSL